MTRDQATVDHFGAEWSRFDQSGADPEELRQIFETYFSVFPWAALPDNAIGIDVGCGSGRWAEFVAPRCSTLFAVDPSADAIGVAGRRLAGQSSCSMIQAAAGELPIRDGALDFGYSLGVLHHTPDTQAALADCVAKLKPGAPFLVYLYYAFDNRPQWFRWLWKGSDCARRAISVFPFRWKLWVTSAIAAAVYWPLARLASFAARRGRPVSAWPLAIYRDKSFYVMRNDSLDRFGTRLESRFTAAQIIQMMEAAGLEDIQVDPTEPFWCALGRRGESSS